MDVIMGFSTGEIIWLEATSQRYARLNKNVSIFWLLGHDHCANYG